MQHHILEYMVPWLANMNTYGKDNPTVTADEHKLVRTRACI